jgi:hypothetical protein
MIKMTLSMMHDLICELHPEIGGKDDPEVVSSGEMPTSLDASEVVTPEERTKADEFATRLRVIVEEIEQLDCDFHDVFDCQ